MIRSRYARWMNDWEYRLETRDSNRVVRPFEWGRQDAASGSALLGGQGFDEVCQESGAAGHLAG